MAGEWEKVTDTKKRGAQTRSKASVSKTKVSTDSVKPRKPLREKNAQSTTASHAQQVSSKQAPLKTLEECRAAIGNAKTLAKEIDGLYERNQDRPNVWLNELVSYLVGRCNISEKHIPKSQYLQEFYLKLDKEQDSVFSKTLKDDSSRYIKSHTRSTLYHETLLTLSEDAARNRPTAGYKLMLQQLAKHFPQDCQKSISDRHFFHASQAHAYRSNPSTCMPLLWAMGMPFLAQPSSLTSQPAVDVLERAMIPVAENKPINHYVVYYLEKMVQQAKKINRKTPLLTPATVAKLIDLTFNAHFDAGDQAKLKDIIRNGLVIPAEAFENLLELLDEKNKNAEFKKFVLETIFGVLCGPSGEEACQIWNLKYGSNITESAMLLKYLVDEMHGMDRKTKGLLSKTTKQFSKANAKFMETGSPSNESKKAMAWVDSMCEDVQNGGSKSSKKAGKSNSGSSSKRKAKRSFLGTIFNMAYYMAIIYLVALVTMDLSAAKWQWSETTTRSVLVGAHPSIEKHLPTLEGHIHRTSDIVASKVGEGYKYVHDLAPEQFDLVEQYCELAVVKAQEGYVNHVYPLFNKGFLWIDSQFMELIIYIKKNNIDGILLAYVDQAKSQINKTTATIVDFTTNLLADTPKHIEASRSALLHYYKTAQLKTGKFLHESIPVAQDYWHLSCQKAASGWESTTHFCQENFGGAIDQGKAVFGVAVEHGSAALEKAQPYVNQAKEKVSPLVDQVIGVFDEFWTMVFEKMG